MKISNFRLGIGLPLSFHLVPSAFFDSFIAMEKPPFLYLRTSNGPIEQMRNNLVEDALRSGCSHLLMLDTDQCYHPQTLTRLLSHRLPVVGCLVYRRYPPFDPMMLRGQVGSYQTIDSWTPDSLVEVDATGTGCLLFDMTVFRRMPRPWFLVRTWCGRQVGEDIGFCADLRAAGYRIYVDTSVPAGHLSQLQITDGTWRLYRYLKNAADRHTVEHGVLTATADALGNPHPKD